jgi:hypothetical protein
MYMNYLNINIMINQKININHLIFFKKKSKFDFNYFN